jgi:hypothetical protein
MESFWATFKTACFDNFRCAIPELPLCDSRDAARSETKALREAKQKRFAYSEVFSNRKRLHSSLNYCSPGITARPLKALHFFSVLRVICSMLHVLNFYNFAICSEKKCKAPVEWQDSYRQRNLLKEESTRLPVST